MASAGVASAGVASDGGKIVKERWSNKKRQKVASAGGTAPSSGWEVMNEPVARAARKMCLGPTGHVGWAPR